MKPTPLPEKERSPRPSSAAYISSEAPMPGGRLIVQTLATVLLGEMAAISGAEAPRVITVDESVLREYTGVYQWEKNGFVYLQMWDEFSGFGKPALVSFDESGEVRTLYPTDHDQFFAGPGAAVPTKENARSCPGMRSRFRSLRQSYACSVC